MDPAERCTLVERLRASREIFLQAAGDVSDDQAAFRPAPDRWSIHEIAEHVAIAEYGMYRLITALYEPLDVPANPEHEEILFQRGLERPNKMDAPERVRPKGRYESLAKALQQFNENRERTIQYIGTCDDDLRMRATQHLLGRLSCQECLMVLIAHPIRHADQVREVKQAPGYPQQ
jgi:uncharacterized damage-inducible protein DinB